MGPNRLAGVVDRYRLERTSRGGVFAAEECLVEVVDASVQSAHILADFGDVLLDASVSGVDRTPQGQANPKDRDDNGNGVGVHEPYSITWSRPTDRFARVCGTAHLRPAVLPSGRQSPRPSTDQGRSCLSSSLSPLPTHKALACGILQTAQLLDGFGRVFGGGGRIRTHGTRQGTTVFKTAAIDHSATPPR